MKKKPFTLADKVNLLFEVRRQPDGKEYPMAALEPYGVEGSNLSRVRNGLNTNPGYNVLAALTEFFHTSWAYWGCTTEAECRQHLDAELVQVAGETVSEIAVRSAQLSEAGRARVLDYVNVVSVAEGVLDELPATKHK